MEKDKELKVRGYLSKYEFTQEQIDLVIKIIDKSNTKLIEEIIAALNKKKIKVTNNDN